MPTVPGTDAQAARLGGSGPDLSTCPKGVILYDDKAVAAAECVKGVYEGTSIQGIRNDADAAFLGKPCRVEFNGPMSDGLFVVGDRKIHLWATAAPVPGIGYVRAADGPTWSNPPSVRVSTFQVDHEQSPHGNGQWMGTPVELDGGQITGQDIGPSGHDGDLAWRVVADADDDPDTPSSIHYCGMTVRF